MSKLKLEELIEVSQVEKVRVWWGEGEEDAGMIPQGQGQLTMDFGTINGHVD